MADTPNDAAPPPDATAELDALRARLAAAEEDLHNHKLQLSEHVNARKRLLRDAEVEKKYSAEPLARDLLGALDNLDRAL
ncbi:MAG TPA: nucleotide exchange factor GrpE, partial [Gemmata sp.]|nr:nucleotide exchange factor GrpE [Gemmata sp.]